MSRIRLPWGAWYGDGWQELPVPPAWRVLTLPMTGAPALSPEECRCRLAATIGTVPIRELARNRRHAVVVVDDLTRPTPAAFLLPLVLEELQAGGIDRRSIRILVGQATHRPLARPELLKKLGPLADELSVLSHTPYENLVSVGFTSSGTPVQFSRWYMEADLRVTLGCVEPHPAYGFSGGVKLVFPGLAGIDAIHANHRPGHLRRGILALDENAMRRDAEEAVRLAGLDAIVNAVVNTRREVVGLFAGDCIAAHRAAAAFAESVYATPVPAPADAVICNAYPKDTELIQVNNAVNVLSAARTPVLRPGGVVIITTAASEGAGWHALANPGGRMYDRPPLDVLAKHPVLVYCPHGRQEDLPPSLPKGSVLLRDWPAVVAAAERVIGPAPTVNCFTEGALQIPVAPGQRPEGGMI